MRSPFVMGNWKLNGSTHRVAALIADLCKELNPLAGCHVAIAPPTIYLDHARHQLAGTSISLGAQDVGINLMGAYTGETSAEMLKDIGAQFIIIGHSERRHYHQESDTFIAQKFGVLKKVGLIPVLCIGETAAENAADQTEAVCARQLNAVLNIYGVDAFSNAIIAYEPVWAIGTGKSASPAQVQAVHQFIRAHLALQDATIADQVIIQYGGSVNDSNAAELFTQPDIDGALVGGASLKAEVFSAIVKAAVKAKNNRYAGQ